MIGVCSVFGLPWCVAATVLCLGHVDSLKMETETSAPGEMPQFLGVRYVVSRGHNTTLNSTLLSHLGIVSIPIFASFQRAKSYWCVGVCVNWTLGETGANFKGDHLLDFKIWSTLTT